MHRHACSFQVPVDNTAPTACKRDHHCHFLSIHAKDLQGTLGGHAKQCHEQGVGRGHKIDEYLELRGVEQPTQLFRSEAHALAVVCSM